MGSKLRIGLLAAGVLGVAVVLFPTVALGGRTNTFTVIAKPTDLATAELGPEGPVADLFVERSDVFDKYGKKIGREFVECTTHFDSTAYCSVTQDLDGWGQIIFTGVLPTPPSGTITFGVIGGTGRYAASRGEARITFRSDKSTKIAFHLDR